MYSARLIAILTVCSFGTVRPTWCYRKASVRSQGLYYSVASYP